MDWIDSIRSTQVSKISCSCSSVRSSISDSSCPADNAGPDPVSTTTPHVASPPSARTASVASRIICNDSGLRRSGRSSVTRPTGPSRSTVTQGAFIGYVLRRCSVLAAAPLVGGDGGLDLVDVLATAFPGGLAADGTRGGTTHGVLLVAVCPWC